MPNLDALKCQIAGLPTIYQRTQARCALARILVARTARSAGDLHTAREEIAYARSRLSDLALALEAQ